jgi:hypothetical protein
MKFYRQFKKKYRILHLFIISVALVVLWWGTWGLLDTYFLPHMPLLAYLIATVVSFFVLYLEGTSTRNS